MKHQLRLHDDHARIELVGTMTLEQAGHQVFQLVIECRERSIERLLVDARNLDGIGVPAMGQRYWFATELAKVAQSSVRIAMVLRGEVIDANKFGVTVAKNRNLTADVFTCEIEALTWLLSDDAPDLS